MIKIKDKRKKPQVEEFASFEDAMSEAAPANSAHIGGSFDDFLKEEGIFETVKAASIKRVIAFQIQKEMNEKGLTKMEVAKRMKTSRSQLDRILDPAVKSINLDLIIRAATCVGCNFTLTLA